MRACAAGRGSCASRHTQAGCDCQGLFSPPEGEGAAPSFGLTEVDEGFPPVFGSWTSTPPQTTLSLHPSVPVGAGWRAHEGVRTRGSSSSPSSARSKYRGVCSVPTPRGAHVHGPCLRSPARDCYPLASLIFPNLYICFCKFSGKLRSNLFHPVIPSPPPPRVRFIFLVNTSCIM